MTPHTESHHSTSIREFLDQHLRWTQPANGNGWRKAHCPLSGHEHDDAQASLSVSPERNRWKCFTPTCESAELPNTERTLTKLQQLMTQGHGGGAATGNGNCPAPATADVQPERRIDIAQGRRDGSITAVYHYQDEHGTLCYRKLRHPHPIRGKTFSFCRPPADGDRDRRWIAGLGNQPHHLYRLPRLLKNPRKIVFVTEGEKDVRTLATLGLPATTIDTGAGTRWSSVAADIAQVKAAGVSRVILLQDNDQAGRMYADHGAAAWLRAGCKVRRVLLPNLPEKGDVSDWIARLQARLGAKGMPKATRRRIIRTALLKCVATVPWTRTKDLPAEIITDTTTPKPDTVVPTVFDGLRPNPSPAQLKERLARLHGADTLTLEIARPTLVAKLEALEVANPTGIVRAAIREAKHPAKVVDASGHQGGTVILPTIEPANEPVDGEQLLAELIQTIERYVIVPKHAALALALAIVFSYAFDAFDIAPIIAVISPTKRCGKTTLLTVVKALVQRALLSANISTASVFRTIAQCKPTLLTDEADKAFDEKPDLLAVYNASHARSSASVIRCVGDNHTPKTFSTWCPKWLGLIGKLPDTLDDRSIIIPLQRKTRHDRPVDRLRFDRVDAEQRPLARKMARWAADHLAQLKDADPTMPESLDDRAQDNWRPLIAIADAIGGARPKQARIAAVALSRLRGQDSDDEGLQLLRDLRRLFKTEKDANGQRPKSLATVTIITRLTNDAAMETSPWAEYRHGKPINAHQLARLLRPFRVEHRKLRVGERTAWGYAYADLTDAFTRYLARRKQQKGLHLPKASGTLEHASKYAGRRARRSGTSKAGVPEGKTSKPARTQGCSSVPEKQEEEATNSSGNGWYAVDPVAVQRQLAFVKALKARADKPLDSKNGGAQ